MKRENVFESDSPALELESQTQRSDQQGHIPFVNGIPVNPYAGTTINPTSTHYQLQAGLPNNAMNAQQIAPNQFTPQFLNQGAFQPQPYPYANNFYQPFYAAPLSPGYFPNAIPAPYMSNHIPAMIPQIPFPYAQTQFAGTPFIQPQQLPQAGFPVQQTNYGTPYQGTQNFQPAINVADGQYTLLPNQYTQNAKNGSAYPKNGERDFISWNPNVNILETDRSFKIEISVPGVARENCRINVDKNNILRVSGTRRWNQETDAVGFTRKEFNYGSFACSFVLTENLQREKITSSCRNGILIISIPKREQINEGEDRSFSEISVN